LALPYPLFIVKPDHRTEAIHWDESNHPNGEIFDLLRVIFEAPAGGVPVKAWLYVAYNSEWRSKPNIHELVALTKLPTTVGSNCLLRIEREWIQAPPYQPFFGGKMIL
jgi:hypothetical protein